MFNKNRAGFTLLEVLLVVAIIAILAGIIILALNPNKQLGDTRNAQRRADVNTILSAVYQYTIDNQGTTLSQINLTSGEICKTSGSCSGLISLYELTNFEKYLVSMPIDPKGSANSAWGTGYWINRDNYNRITVTAPQAENDITISATR